ncbi:MAG TPA: hypothetical protein VNZ49_11940 [Bacteroidia bacterium]|jgi:hypothetical protein|nr:hypothetical protein [Bacteroidia bacterium]
MRIKTIILLASLMFACGQRKENKQQVKPVVTEQTKQKEEKPYSNPALIFGSSFGEFFQSLYRNNFYKEMLAFTSIRTKKKFGSKLLHHYKNEFKFDYELGHLSNITQEGDTIFLTYTKAYRFATRHKVKIPCVLENDSIKLLLTNLRKNSFE